MRRSSILLLALLAGCASAPPAAPPPEATSSPIATPVPVPTPTPTPAAVPTVPPPATMPDHELDPPLIRILLVRTSTPVLIPQPGRAYRVTADGRSSWLWGPLDLRVRAAGPAWWQVGAFTDSATLSAATESLKIGLGPAVQIAFEPSSDGLTRLRAAWSGGDPPDPAAVLEDLGFPGAFPVAAPGVLRIEGVGGKSVSTGDEALIEPAGEWPVAVDGGRYRGRLLARAVGNETLVINELNLEFYLRGVVPAEMGPSQFPELDALKAQTVAARTYAVAHVGDHADEGWDLCDTPACQVYRGVRVEHQLSNRAVEETAGLVAVFAGEPIDAMYTSTCGGHTENASLLFEGRAKPYLAAVPCVWDRPIQIAGLGRTGPWIGSTDFAAAVAFDVLSLAPGATPGTILHEVGRFSGISAPVPEVADPEGYSAALLAVVAVDPPAGIAPLTNGLERLLFLADLYKIPLDPPTNALDGSWPAAAALAALELRGEIERDRGEAVPRPSGAGIFPRRADHGEDLVLPLPLWERWSNGYRRLAGAEIQPGTVLERLRHGDRVVALVIRQSGGGPEADRRSAWREWIRERSWPELEKSLGVHELERLTVTARSPSGRVVGLKAVSSSGLEKEWTGFDVRRALGLPETLFSMHLRTAQDGRKRVRFMGRGWGHGIGLCQNGAFGLARSGMDFERILKHYYSGIQLVRWPAEPE